MEERSSIDIAAAIARLKAHKPSDGYLPAEFSEDLAILLFGSARLGRWSTVARALHDTEAALALFRALFPDDRWMLGYHADGPDRPAYGFASFPPYNALKELPGLLPPPISQSDHDVCPVAILIAVLQRRQKVPARHAAAGVIQMLSFLAGSELTTREDMQLLPRTPGAGIAAAIGPQPDARRALALIVRLAKDLARQAAREDHEDQRRRQLGASDASRCGLCAVQLGSAGRSVDR
jgi:hypothetical protein